MRSDFAVFPLDSLFILIFRKSRSRLYAKMLCVSKFISQGLIWLGPSLHGGEELCYNPGLFLQSSTGMAHHSSGICLLPFLN